MGAIPPGMMPPMMPGMMPPGVGEAQGRNGGSERFA